MVRIEDIIDIGDSVLVVVRDRGRLRDTSADIDANVAAIWTVSDGLVTRAEFYADRKQAFDVARPIPRWCPDAGRGSIGPLPGD